MTVPPESECDRDQLLRSIDDGIRAFHDRATHRESVIDRLHEENQVLRHGLRRTVIQPVVTDLARLYDGLTGQAARLAAEPGREADGALFAGFADDVVMTLDRCGFSVVTAEPGETYERGRHLAAGFADRPGAPGTVADTVSAGLMDQESGRFQRPIRVRLHRPAPARTGEE